MIRNVLTMLRDLAHDRRGNSLVAYALLLGGIAVVLVGGLVDFSDGVSFALTSEADHIAEIAGTSSPGSSPTPNASNPTTPTNNPTTPSSPRGGRGRGRR